MGISLTKEFLSANISGNDIAIYDTAKSDIPESDIKADRK
jgi:hypothetical protein